LKNLRKDIFKVKLHRKAVKFIDKLPQNEKERIIKILKELRKPFSLNIKKLKGSEFYRIRAGKFRVIFYIDHENKVVVIFRIDKRERVYKRI